MRHSSPHPFLSRKAKSLAQVRYVAKEIHLETKLQRSPLQLPFTESARLLQNGAALIYFFFFFFSQANPQTRALHKTSAAVAATPRYCNSLPSPSTLQPGGKYKKEPIFALSCPQRSPESAIYGQQIHCTPDIMQDRQMRSSFHPAPSPSRGPGADPSSAPHHGMFPETLQRVPNRPP